MANLPGIRITEALPFQHSGCDYAGPFILKERRGRSPRKTKLHMPLSLPCNISHTLGTGHRS